MTTLLCEAPPTAHLTPADTVNQTSHPAHSPRLDVLRVGACLAVILLHLSATLVADKSLLGTIHWHVSNAVNASTRWCVPIFIMVSGALLLDPRKHTSSHTFWKRRMGRLLPAIMTWSAIYFAWRAYSWQETISLGVVAHDLLFGTPFYHLYFLFIIAGLYLVTPFLATALRDFESSRIRQLVFIIAMLVLGATLFEYRYGSPNTSVFTMFLPYLVYFIAGWYSIHLPSGNSATYSVAICSATVVTAVMTAVIVGVYGLDSRWASYFYDHFSPNVMVTVVSVFLFALHGSIPPSIEQIALRLAPLTFGVYLAHPLVIELLRYLYFYVAPGLLRPPYYVPVTFFFTCALAFPLIALMQVVPGLRRIV